MAQTALEQSNFYVALRSVFTACPLSMNRQLDLTNEQAIAPFGLRPRKPLPGMVQSAEAIYSDGSVVVGRASGPVCTVQFAGAGYKEVREAVVNELTKSWRRASDTKAGSVRHQTYLAPTGDSGVSFRMQVLTNDKLKSVMVKSDHLKVN